MIDSNNIRKKISAIMFTDMVGFSRMTAADPLNTRRLNEVHHEIIVKIIHQFTGFIRQTTGDGYFVEFSSASDAVQAAISIQSQIRDRNKNVPIESAFQIRIGIHTGEVFEKDDQIFGQTVNIAARLEPLCEPGSINISSATRDQVTSKDLKSKFKSKGQFNLKNIDSPTEIFQFDFEDNTKNLEKADLKKVKKYFNWFKQELSDAYTLLGLILFFTIGILSWTGLEFNRQENLRNPNSRTESFIDSSWQISFNQNNWQDYDTKKNWAFADKVDGFYKLKNEFSLENLPKEPALILGLLGDNHRVFINGYFVGGSEHLSQLASYPVDPRILKVLPETNQIIVESYTRKSLNPGLIELAQIKPQLGENSKIELLKEGYFFRFFVLRNIFLAFSFFVFILSMVLVFKMKNRRETVFSSLFLILGSLHYLYYNPYFNSLFEYPLLRSLRISAILLSSCILISGFYFVSGGLNKSKVHMRLALFLGVVIISFFSQPQWFGNSSEFVQYYNWFLVAGLLYTVSMLPQLLPELMNIKNKTSFRSQFKDSNFLHQLLFLSTLSLHLLSYLGALKYSSATAFFSTEARMYFGEIGLALPFVFAIARVFIAAVEMSADREKNIESQKRQNTQLALAEILASSDTSLVRAKSIFLKTVEYFGASKAQLLLGDSAQFTVIESVYPEGYIQYQNTEAPRAKTGYSRGILKYVETTRQGLAVQNIDKDTRFVSEGSSYTKSESAKKYTTNSCLVVPLKYEGVVCGFMTYTDRKDKKTFSDSDLSVALYAASLVSILIQAKSTSKSNNRSA